MIGGHQKERLPFCLLECRLQEFLEHPKRRFDLRIDVAPQWSLIVPHAIDLIVIKEVVRTAFLLLQQVVKR